MEMRIVGAIESAENELGIRIPDDVWLDVLFQSYQKMKSINKPIDYLPILFKNELTDYYNRLEINLKGVANYVQCLLAKAM